MKVLQLSVHFSPNMGGVETHLDDLVEGLVKAGHQVMVLCYRPLVTTAKWQIWQSQIGLRVLRLPWLPGLFYRLVDQPFWEFIYLALGLWLVMPWVLLWQRPRVIHAHGVVAGFVGVFWGKIFKIRTVISTHSIYHFPAQGAYRQLACWIFSQADSVICLSDQSVAEIVGLGVKPHRVSRFTLWINQAIFKPGERSKLKRQLGWEKRIVVLFIGRLVEIKGVNELLAAAKKMDPKFLVVIAGDGPLVSRVKSAVVAAKGRIQFLGRVPNAMVVKYYQAADVVIVPSTHDEGFGRVILEALAVGTPVIAANRGAIPEAMDQTVGQLIEVSPENIVSAVEEMTKSHQKLKQLSRAAVKFAQSRYSQRNLDQIVKQY